MADVDAIKMDPLGLGEMVHFFCDGFIYIYIYYFFGGGGENRVSVM